jgi:hypothetical protein
LIDGLGALVAGAVVLVLREFLSDVYRLPLELVTFIGLVNIAYSPLGLTLAFQQRRQVGVIASLALANLLWTVVCVTIAIRFWNDASIFGLAHLVLEGAWVAALGVIEWRGRRALAAVAR